MTPEQLFPGVGCYYWPRMARDFGSAGIPSIIAASHIAWENPDYVWIWHIYAGRYLSLVVHRGALFDSLESMALKLLEE